MARLLTCGFETQSSLEMSGQNHLISTAITRVPGGASCQFSNTGYYAYQQSDFGTYFTELYIRFAVYMPSLTTQPRCGLTNTAGSAVIYLSYGGGTPITLVYYNGSSWVTLATSTTNIPVNTWHLVEWHIRVHPTAGVSEVKQNGVMTSVYRGPTQWLPQAYSPTRVYWIPNGTATAHYYDDIAINDLSGDSFNSWCGDGYVARILPNGNGDYSQLTGSDGNSTDNYLLVDDPAAHNSDTDYVYSITDGLKDLYNMASMPTLGSNSIRFVQPLAVSRRLNAGSYLDSEKVKLGLKTGSTEVWSADTETTAGYTILRGDKYILNPETGLPWTESEINAIQVGMET
jgi:hypothetical protein